MHAGKLRAAGYDARQRVLQVELSNGTLLQYNNVSAAVWQRFSHSGNAWSYYRDNIEEEFAPRKISQASANTSPDHPPTTKNPLDELFK